MKKYQIFTLFIVFIIQGTLGFAANTRDTIAKVKFNKIQGVNYQGAEYVSYLKEAKTYILGNDMEKGVSLLSNGINGVFRQTKIERVLPYNVAELFSLISYASTKELSKNEKQAAYFFIKAIFLEKKPSDKAFKAVLEKAPNTIFIRRFKVLVGVFSNDSTIINDVDKLIKEAPTLVNLNFLKAQNLYDANKYEECITYCNNVVGLSPEYAIAYQLRGKCYYELNKLSEALTDYNTAIQLFPEYNEVVYERAVVYLDLKKYTEAIAGFKLINRLNPSYKWNSYNLSRAYKYHAMADSALHFIGLHIKENPDDADGYDIKGDIYYDRNEYNTAISLYTQSIQLEPDEHRFYESRGNAYYYADSVDKAKKDFGKALELDAKNDYVLSRLGDCYYRDKDYEQSLTYYKRAIEIDSNDKYSYVSLNTTYTHLKRYKDAVDAALKAIKIDSTYSSALGNLGWTYYCYGKYDECIKYSSLAIKQDATASYARFNLALATLRKGDFEKAKKLYASYVKICLDNKYKINDGAVTDLNDLVEKKILVKECNFIIKNIIPGK